MRCIALSLLLVLLVAGGAQADWNPQAFATEDTLEFLTVGPEEGEYWSPVWLVVIDGEVYIRLGSRAAGRMEANTMTPFVKVRIAGQEFDRVEAISTPEMAEAVEKAMGEKYWSDVFIRYFPHPLTMRLVPVS